MHAPAGGETRSVNLTGFDPWAARNLSDDFDGMAMGPLVIDDGKSRGSFDGSLFNNTTMQLPSGMPPPVTKELPAGDAQCPPGYEPSRFDPSGCVPVQPKGGDGEAIPSDPTEPRPMPDMMRRHGVTVMVCVFLDGSRRVYADAPQRAPVLPAQLDTARARPMPPMFRGRGVNVMVCVFSDGSHRVYR